MNEKPIYRPNMNQLGSSLEGDVASCCVVK